MAIKLDINQVILMYEKGLSLKKIATHFECGDNTIKRRLLSASVELRDKNQKQKDKNGWWQNKAFLEQKYIHDEMSTTEIGLLVGVGARTVTDWLKKFSITARPTGGAYKKGIKMGPEFGRKISESKKGRNTGADNPNWKGEKISDDIRERRSYDAKIWRKACKERDKYQCTRCGSKEKLHVHHILEYKDYPERRWDINNGQTVCVFCHEKIHQRTFPDWLTGREQDRVKNLGILRVPKSEKKEKFVFNPLIIRWLSESNSIENIRAMLKAGSNIIVGRDTLSKFMRENNIDTKKKQFWSLPSKEQLQKVYAANNLEQTGQHFLVGQTLVLKWMEHYDIPTRNNGKRV